MYNITYIITLYTRKRVGCDLQLLLKTTSRESLQIRLTMFIYDIHTKLILNN